MSGAWYDSSYVKLCFIIITLPFRSEPQKEIQVKLYEQLDREISGRGHEDDQDEEEYGETVLAYFLNEHLNNEYLLHVLDVPNSAGMTPLMYTASKNKRVKLKTLIMYGCYVNWRWPEWNQATALMAAVRNPDCVRLLVEAGTDISATNSSGATALHMAAAEKQYQSMEILLKHGQQYVNHKDTSGNTALMKVSELNSYECVKLLLEYNADVNLTNDMGQNALMLSIKSPNVLPEPKVTKMLLDACLKSKADVNVCDKYGRSVVHYACSHGNPDILAMLLNKRANYNILDNSNQSPLMFTVFYNTDTEACFKLLLQRGCDVFAVDSMNRTALVHAARNGRHTYIESLAYQGSDVNHMDSEQMIPLYYAAKDVKICTVKSLLKLGSDIKINGKTEPMSTQMFFYLTQVQRANPSVIDLLKLLMIAGMSFSRSKPWLNQYQDILPNRSMCSLLQWSRVATRRHLKTVNTKSNLFCLVQDLPLPQKVKEYLLFFVDLEVKESEILADVNARPPVISLAP